MLIALEEFDALVVLLHSDPASPVNRAARAVLVDGVRQADAMRATGVSRSAVCDTVKKYRDADALILKAYGIEGRRGSEPFVKGPLWTIVRFPDGSWTFAKHPNAPIYSECEKWEISASSLEQAIQKAQIKRSRARKKAAAER